MINLGIIVNRVCNPLNWWLLENPINLYINLACLSVCLLVCLFVCLYPINVKTAEPIGPKFFAGSRVTPGKVYGWSNFLKTLFLKILKIRGIFYKIREICVRLVHINDPQLKSFSKNYFFFSISRFSAIVKFPVLKRSYSGLQKLFRLKHSCSFFCS